MNRQAVYAIALGAGVAAGLMAVAGLRPSALSLPLFLAAPLAVYVASLGWGTGAGIIAALVAAAVGLLWHGPAVATVTTFLLFAPAAYAGHLANLAQPDPQGSGTIWYPLSSVLLRLAVSVAIGFVIAGVLLGYDRNEMGEALVGLLKELTTSDPNLDPPSEEMLQQSAYAYAAMLPAVVPGMWLMAHVLVMHLAAVVTAKSGLLARPPEDIAANLVLPSQALAIPVLGLAGMALLSSPAYEISAVVAGVGIAAFALSGIADLHVVTRGRPARGIILFFAWLTLVIFGFPVFVFAAMGMARSLRPAPPKLPPPGPQGPRGIINKH